MQGPAHIVHGDYTLRSSRERLLQLTQRPSVNDTLRDHIPKGQGLIPKRVAERALSDGRFAIINLWRNIESTPVSTHPLALCDGQSVEPEDLVVFEIHMPDRVGENYWAKHAERHTFYSYPAMMRSEALLIKQWDSAGLLATSNGEQSDRQGDGPCTFSFHSAFDDPENTEKRARSMEHRSSLHGCLLAIFRPTFPEYIACLRHHFWKGFVRSAG